jgi:hypothetical protein
MIRSILEANYTKGSGIDDFDDQAWGADLVLSQGFAFLTPYMGAGHVSAPLKPDDGLKQSFGIRDEDVDQGRLFVGALRAGLCRPDAGARTFQREQCL